MIGCESSETAHKMSCEQLSNNTYKEQTIYTYQGEARGGYPYDFFFLSA